MKWAVIPASLLGLVVGMTPARSDPEEGQPARDGKQAQAARVVQRALGDTLSDLPEARLQAKIALQGELNRARPIAYIDGYWVVLVDLGSVYASAPVRKSVEGKLAGKPELSRLGNLTRALPNDAKRAGELLQNTHERVGVILVPDNDKAIGDLFPGLLSYIQSIRNSIDQWKGTGQRQEVLTVIFLGIFSWAIGEIASEVLEQLPAQWSGAYSGILGAVERKTDTDGDGITDDKDDDDDGDGVKDKDDAAPKEKTRSVIGACGKIVRCVDFTKGGHIDTIFSTYRDVQKDLVAEIKVATGLKDLAASVPVGKMTAAEVTARKMGIYFRVEPGKMVRLQPSLTP